MNTAVWIVQILLALAFALAGLMKVSQPIPVLAKYMSWVNHFAPSIVRTIGVLELLGAAGLILPAATGILPWLTPLAAIGLVLTMIGAMATHIRLKQFPMILPNIILLLLAAFVVYGRLLAAAV